MFAWPTNIVEQGCIVSRQLHLVQGGDEIEVTAANASEYLRAIERMYLGEGILLQMRALKSGFYSIVSQDKVAMLGASGLLHHMGALSCPPFDRVDLEIAFEPNHGYTTESPQFKWLIDTLLSLDECQRRATVRFITGSPSLPGGFQGLAKRITVQMHKTHTGQPSGDAYMPQVQTCAGLFKLPRFVSRMLHIQPPDIAPFRLIYFKHPVLKPRRHHLIRYSSADRLREKLLVAIFSKYQPIT